jgi:hypothetical protein
MNAIKIALSRTPRLSRGVLPLLLILVGSHAWAQDDSARKPAPPDGPLLAPAPDFAQWTVTFTYPKDPSQKDNAAPAAPETRTKTIITTKTKDIVHEETINGLGAKREDWHIGTVQYALVPGSTTWYQGSAKSDFPAKGFRDLDWVTEDNYIGRGSLAGHACLIFAPSSPQRASGQNGAGLMESLDTLPTVAYIDAETRLPVQVRENGVSRAFQFASPPTEVLSLPPDLEANLQKVEQTRARLSQPPPRPY